MRLRCLLFVLSAALALQAQTDMNVDQLAEFVRSEIALKQHSDKQIAAYLKKTHLTEKLTGKTVTDLEAQGAGPKTVEALKKLEAESAALKPPSHDATYSPETAPEQAAPAKSVTAIGPRVPIPPPDSVKQAAILDQIKQYVATYTQSLPDFQCLQVTRRYVDYDLSDTYHLIDTINAHLTYVQGQEHYSVVSVNGKLTNVGLYESTAASGGAISTGEFGSLMKGIFDPKSAAEFNWDHWGTLRGKRMAVYNYFVDSGHSDWHITYERDQQIITAYRGLIYADEYTGVVSRIKFEAVDIPKSFPVTSAVEILDYDDAVISGQTYICPLKAVVRLASGKQRTRNDIEFRLYRKFGSDIDIQYGSMVDAPAPLPENKTQEQPAQPKQAAAPSNPWTLPTPPPPPPK